MAHVKVMVQLAIASGIPEDRPVNTLHFDCAVAATGATAILADLPGWFSECAPIYANTVSQNGHRVKMYDMADPTPRAPIVDTTFNLTSGPSGAPLPSEVAICLSFQGVRLSGQSQARRRGRIYIGPLDTSTVDADGRPGGVAIGAVADMGDLILADSVASGDYAWAVYSVTDDSLVQVLNGWVDNAFDIQRRRGLAPTSRTTFP